MHVYARQSPPSLRKHCRHARNHDKCFGTQTVQCDKHLHGCSSFLAHSHIMKQNITYLCRYFNQFTLDFLWHLQIISLHEQTRWKKYYYERFRKSLKNFMEMLLRTKCDFGLPARCKSHLRYLGIFGFYTAYNGSLLPTLGHPKMSGRNYRSTRRKIPRHHRYLSSIILYLCTNIL
jgi:hypothetical protein